MTLPILLYQGGTHGNFLSRCLSVSSGTEQDFDFYLDKKGAHANQGFIRLVDHLHPYPFYPYPSLDTKDIWCYIHITPMDLYILNWHIMYAAGEFGIDLLNVTDMSDILLFVNSKQTHPVVKDGLKDQVNIFKDSGITGLREMFKLSFRSSNGSLQNQKEYYEKYTVANKFNFEWFYDYENFKHNLIRLLTDLGKEYSYDIEHHWKDFINRKQEVIQSKVEVERAMECFRSNLDMDISNFCVYQQGYLDHLVEQYLGYEIELWQDGYPQNMRNYKPVQATID